MGGAGGGPEAAAALKDEGNVHYKNGNFLKAAAVYTQAIKADPSNATLYRSVAGSVHSFLAFLLLSSGWLVAGSFPPFPRADCF